MTLTRLTVMAADVDPCDAHLQELMPLLEDATQDSGALRSVLGRATKANDTCPCACRRLPLLIAIATEVLNPGDSSAEEVRHYRSQAADCDPGSRLTFARLRFTALDGRAKRHLRCLTPAERVLGRRFKVAAWWAGMYMNLDEVAIHRSTEVLQQA